MKVLLIGASGRLGLRITVHLLTSGHECIAFVRSSSRFLGLLPTGLAHHEHLKVVEGDALSVDSLAAALKEHEPEMVINAAGFAALLPWQHSSFPDIAIAVADACAQELPKEGRRRLWQVAGMFVCDRPGGGLLMDSNWLYTESRTVWETLKSKKGLVWSMLCPSLMFTGPPLALEASSPKPPSWPVPGWICHIPLIGAVLVTLAAAVGYRVSYDSVALWLVRNMEDERWAGGRVAVKVRR